MDDYFICPICGAEVPAKARSCPECGSDERTGWSEDTLYDGTGIEWFEEGWEDAEQRERDRSRKKKRWIIYCLVALILFLLLYMKGFF